MIFQLHLGIAGSSQLSAESSSLTYKPTVRLGCSPPRLAATQLPSASEFVAFFDTDFHRADVAPSWAHSFRATPAKAGSDPESRNFNGSWIRAFAGMTVRHEEFSRRFPGQETSQAVFVKPVRDLMRGNCRSGTPRLDVLAEEINGAKPG